MRSLLLIAVVLGLVLLASSSATAQVSGNQTVETIQEIRNDDDAAILIGDDLLLWDYYLEGDRATIVVEAVDKPTGVTVTDGGALMSGLQTRPSTHRALPGQRTEISVPVVAYDGYIFLTVGSGGYLQGIPIRKTSPMIGGPWTHQDAQASALGGAAGTGVMSLIVVMRSVWGRDDSPEWIA